MTNGILNGKIKMANLLKFLTILFLKLFTKFLITIILLKKHYIWENFIYFYIYIYMPRRTRRTRCWTRKNRTGKNYVVCNRSRGQKKVYRKKRKGRSKKKSGGRRRRTRRRRR